jgi:hypothetical protein
MHHLLLFDLGDGRFTTVAVQTKTFGLPVGKTIAGLRGLIAYFGAAATRE